ncbi:MAG: hypothetical protein ACFB8W_07575 [Elainellaceae cyanobacterium]
MHRHAVQLSNVSPAPDARGLMGFVDLRSPNALQFSAPVLPRL